MFFPFPVKVPQHHCITENHIEELDTHFGRLLSQSIPLDESGLIEQEDEVGVEVGQAQTSLEVYLEKRQERLLKKGEIEKLVEEVEENNKSDLLGKETRERLFIKKHYDCEVGNVKCPSLVNIFFGYGTEMDQLVDCVVEHRVYESFTREKRKLFLDMERWVDALPFLVKEREPEMRQRQKEELKRFLDLAINKAVEKKFTMTVIKEDFKKEWKKELSKTVVDDCLGAVNYKHTARRGEPPRSKINQQEYLRQVIKQIPHHKKKKKEDRRGIIQKVVSWIPEWIEECGGFVDQFSGWGNSEGRKEVVKMMVLELRGKHDGAFANNCQQRDAWLKQIHQSLLAVKEYTGSSALKSDVVRGVKWHYSLAKGVKEPMDSNVTIPLQVLKSWSVLSRHSFIGKMDLQQRLYSFSSLTKQDYSDLFERGTEIEVPIKVTRNPPQNTSPNQSIFYSSLSQALSLSMYGVTDFDQYLYLKMDEQQGLNLWAACETPGFPCTSILLLFDESGGRWDGGGRNHRQSYCAGTRGRKEKEETVVMKAVLLCPDKQEALQKHMEKGIMSEKFPILRIRQTKGKEEMERRRTREKLRFWG